MAFGDLDHDGDQDVFEDMGGAVEGDGFQNVLYLNPGHGNHWITLLLEGVQTNRCAMGARVRVHVGEKAGERDIHATVGTGGSFGCNTLQQEIGLGKATAIQYVEVFWPASKDPALRQPAHGPLLPDPRGRSGAGTAGAETDQPRQSGCRGTRP